MNVSLFYSNHRYVLASDVSFFRVTRKIIQPLDTIKMQHEHPKDVFGYYIFYNYNIKHFYMKKYLTYSSIYIGLVSPPISI
jgi:hypothetical protein